MITQCKQCKNYYEVDLFTKNLWEFEFCRIKCWEENFLKTKSGQLPDVLRLDFQNNFKPLTVINGGFKKCQ